MKTGTIRYSTDEDLKEILSWLKNQDKQGVDATFHCNRSLTIEHHQQEKLIVYIDLDTDKAIAYQWGGLISPGILEVKADKRGLGIGTKLVKYRIEEAYRNNNCLLQIQCKPVSSIKFWVRMGFEIYDNNMAYRLLSKKHDIPQNTIPISVKISFYPKEKEWDSSTSAIKTHTPYAVKKLDDEVILSERISFFDATHRSPHDALISIDIEDKNIYFGKAKRREAEELGVCRDGNAFYIDKIQLK